MSIDRSRSLAFYTGFYGNTSNWAFVIPPVPSEKYDCYYFTNNDVMYERLAATKWIRVKIDVPICNDDTLDAMSSKELKACPHRFAQLATYTYVCWLDSKISVNASKVEAVIDSMEHGDKQTGIAFTKHPIQFETVWGEYELAIKYPKYAAQKESYERYIQNKLASGASEKLLVHYCSGFILRNISNPAVIRFNEEWFKNILECGIECQICLQFVHQEYTEIIQPLERNYCWQFI